MAGLHYLKHTFTLSDELTVERWTENPYWQYFCGMKYFEHEMPIHPTSMTRWRKKVGDTGMEKAMGRRSSPGLRVCVEDGACAFRQVFPCPSGEARKTRGQKTEDLAWQGDARY